MVLRGRGKHVCRCKAIFGWGLQLPRVRRAARAADSYADAIPNVLPDGKPDPVADAIPDAIPDHHAPYLETHSVCRNTTDRSADKQMPVRRHRWCRR